MSNLGRRPGLRRARVLVALAAIVPPIAGCSERSAAVTETMRLSVTGMHCEGCEQAICDKVLKIEGVATCSASHLEESVEVLAPAARRTEIESAIRRLGYTVR
jgi:copper chaperone CopZ